jgi:glycogen phosphorylase
MRVASALVRGCDLWLNLPRYPLEASGTSGMKAAMNGGLNLSVLDGWWAEAYDAGDDGTVTNGWAIEPDPTLSPEEQDRRDSTALYDLLEKEVVPLWTERDGRGIPTRWLAHVKRSLTTIGPAFCATRMMDDYLRTMYHGQPASQG